MTKEEAMKLKLHDLIQWEDDPADTGEIVYVTDECVSVKWANDGVIGVYRFNSLAIKYINHLKGESDAHRSERAGT